MGLDGQTMKDVARTFSCDVTVGVEESIAFIMLVFKYSVAVSISSFFFKEIKAEVE